MFFFFFLKSVRTVGGSVCVCPVGRGAGIPKLPLEIQVLWPDQDLLRTAGMNPQDYRCNQVPGQNLIRCTFATLLFPVPAGVCRLEAKPGWVSQLYCAAPVSQMGTGWAPAHPTPVQMDCLYHKQMAFCIPGVFSKRGGGFLLCEL